MTRWVLMPFLNGVKTYQDAFPMAITIAISLMQTSVIQVLRNSKKEKDSVSSLPLL